MARPIDGDELKSQVRHMPRTVNPDLVQYSLVQAIIENAPTLTPQNEALTIEQLREMDGEPVWLDRGDGFWALVDTDDDCVWLDRGGSLAICELEGNAYRRPPERREDTL